MIPSKAGSRVGRGGRSGIFITALIVSIATTALALREGPAAGSSSTQPASDDQLGPFQNAIIITIEDAITDVTRDSIERRLKRDGQSEFDLVIFELDTPGGALGATLDICSAIKRLRDNGVRTYAWVNDMAYSAGTIIALATDGIVMTRNATIGDCQPIQVTVGGASAIDEDMEAKGVSPLLAELRDSARRNDYNFDMVLALIRPEMEIFWLENSETGEQRFVDTSGRDELFGLAESTGRSAGKEGGGFLGLFGGKESDAASAAPGETVSDEDSRTAWRYVKSHPDLGEIRQPIVAADKELLTMRTKEATAYGFCMATLNEDGELRSHFNVANPIDRLENTWIETVVEWLASPAVRGVLFLLMMLGAYMEFQTPGFGVAGGIALVALVLFLGAPYLAGYTVTWEILAIVLGIALLAVEAFVIPGFGVAGIAGIVLLAVGLLASFVPAEMPGQQWPRWPDFPGSFRFLRNGLYALAGGLTGSIVCMVLLAKYFPKVPVAGRIIAPNPDHDAIQIDDPYEGAARVGDIGRSESLLRPAGKARFGATLVDVVSEGEYIESGMRVEVVERYGNRVVVRRVD